MIAGKSSGFTPLASGSGWQEVAAQIRTMIESGTLPVGTALPAERELSPLLGVSRSSVREAIRHLGSMGLLSTRHGAATRVVARTVAQRWPGPDNRLADLFEVRRILEPEAAALAAHRRSAAHLADLDGVLARMTEALDAEDSAKSSAERSAAHDIVVQTDREFHDLIGRAAGNGALSALVERLQSIGDDERSASLAVPGQGRRAHAGHAAILQALRQRDVDAARTAMSVHLDDAVRLLVAHTTDAGKVPASGKENSNV